MTHPQQPASTWLLPRIWWAGSLFSHCFWLVTRLRLSLTFSARARKQASHLAVPTLLLWTDDRAAISMKSTRGCGSLGAASPALGPVHRADWGEEASRKRGTAQAGSRDKTGSQDGLSLIPSKGWYISVCTKLSVVYTGIYSYVINLHT